VCSRRSPTKGLGALKQSPLQSISDAAKVDQLLSKIDVTVYEKACLEVQLLQLNAEVSRSVVVTRGSVSTVSLLLTDITAEPGHAQDLQSKSEKIVPTRSGFAKAKGCDKISQLLKCLCREHIAGNAAGDGASRQHKSCRKWYLKNLPILVCYEDPMHHSSLSGFLSLHGKYFNSSK
jgi:hypothetical protein